MVGRQDATGWHEVLGWGQAWEPGSGDESKVEKVRSPGRFNLRRKRTVNFLSRCTLQGRAPHALARKAPGLV